MRDETEKEEEENSDRARTLLLPTTGHPTCGAVEALDGCLVLSHVALKHRSMIEFRDRERERKRNKKKERNKEVFRVFHSLFPLALFSSSQNFSTSNITSSI